MNLNTVIIGAGISGLSTANFLSKKITNFLIIESSDKVGGIIDSFESEGYTCENGPNTVLNNNMGVQELIDDLNLSEEIIYPDEQGVKNRYVLLNGKPTKIPLTFYDFFSTPLLSFFSKLRILLEVFIPRHKKNTDVKSFISRRFGSEFHDKLIVPFLTGIYADDTKFMSAKHTLKNIWELEQKYGSVILGMIKMKRKSKPKIFTLLGGLSKLTDILKLKFDDKILFNTSISKIEKTSDGFNLITNKEEKISCKNIISTIPSYSLSCLIPDNKLKHLLAKKDYIPIDVFHFGYDKKSLKNKIDGFGLLTKPEDNKSFLGILYSSNIFKHVSGETNFLFTILVGGKRQRNLCKKNPKEIENIILKEINSLLKINSKPQFIKHYRWKRGIPTYDLSISDLILEIVRFENENPNFNIHGNFHKGVSVSDCILNSKNLVENKF